MRLPGWLSTHRPLLPLLVVAGTLRLTFFSGLVASDDTEYAGNAIAMLKGSLVFSKSMTSMRIALNAAAAATFALFGTSECTLGLPALVSSLLTLVIVYLISFMLSGRVAAVVAGLLYALCPLNILNASVLLPELPLGFFVALGVLLFLIGLRAVASRAAIAWTLGSGLSIGIGYLAKEPAALIMAAFALMSLTSLARGDRAWWVSSLPLVGFAAVFAVETAAYWVSTGEILHRFRGIAAHEVAGALNTEHKRRLQSFWLYPRSMFFVVNQVGFLYYLLAAGAALAIVKRWRTPCLIVLWLLLPLLYLEFGSTSLTSYNALPKQPRYLEAVTAPAVILIGLWTAASLRTPGLLQRRLVYVALGCYVVSAPLFTAVSFIDQQARIQPIRDVATFLSDSDLRPVYATSNFTDGLWFLSLPAAVPEVSRICHGCTAGPCTPASPSRLGEVWAATLSSHAAVFPPVSDCARWRVAAEVVARPPAAHRWIIRPILVVADRLPLPTAVTRELQPLRNLTVSRHVTVNRPSEDP